MEALKMEKVAAILRTEEREFLTIKDIPTPPPAVAKIRASVRCASCGERFMESRGRVKNGTIVCLPCSGQD
jgi:formylmethanofuran dehydrogenase subunit E